MRKELEQKLCQDFPDMFAGKDRPLTENLMAFGCECEDGWFQLIYDFCVKAKGSGLLFTQIKEKFGGLRLYHDFSNWTPDCTIPYEDVEKWAEKAEHKSLFVCEICGKNAVLCHRGSWLKTLCPVCMEKEKYEVCE